MTQVDLTTKHEHVALVSRLDVPRVYWQAMESWERMIDQLPIVHKSIHVDAQLDPRVEIVDVSIQHRHLQVFVVTVPLHLLIEQ